MNPTVARARALIDLHRFEEAIELAQSALQADPGDGEAAATIARGHIGAERPREAGAWAKRALQLEPENLQALMYLAVAEASSSRPSRGLELARQAVAKAPDLPQTHSLVAALEAEVGSPGRAIESAERAVQLDPEYAGAHEALGSAFYRDGRFAASEQALRKALELDPGNAQALAALGATLAARGRPDDAAELLKMAARADVRDVAIHVDMVRYVRGAAGGLASWPVMGMLVVLAGFGIHDYVEYGHATLAFGLIALACAGALLWARITRLRRFPPAARSIINKLSFEAKYWGANDSGSMAWWRSSRAVIVWVLFLLVFALRREPAERGAVDVSVTWTWVAVLGGLALLLAIWIYANRAKANKPSPLYEAPAPPGAGQGG